MVEIWRSILKDVPKKESRRKDFELPVIVPIVLYNGSRKWTAKTSYKEILNSYETFGEYAVDFKYILIDVNRYTKGGVIEAGEFNSVCIFIRTEGRIRRNDDKT
ncbi:hypothetical protein M2349_001688 [Caldanaerobacter subterraneus subsp. tengcongensis MB4]|uniref:Transposase (putative) YhgA-like domain-containing protein n=1 Tax=Caldanaerobacter subterraneus subsp. tengcongensis (strain DSM 15242 / JCM 11007 / NBRC 100824 / MB4) TaxID=273068 RepID=Q8RBX9_CALS4